MIKKFIKAFSIFILFLFPNVVGADVLNNKKHEHILTVEKMTINDSQITFNGYSFISHMDNLGKYDEDIGEKNLQTYLIAYVGNWTDIYPGYDEDDPNMRIVKDINKCINSDKCLMFEANMGKYSRDFFYSRCTNEGCTEYEYIKNHRKASGLINNESCYDGEEAVGFGVTDNECIYKNVDFSITVDVENIVKEFSGGDLVTNYVEDIKFKILAYNNYINEGLVSGFNIHKKACYVGSNLCGSGTITTAWYDFELAPFATTIEYDAVDAYSYRYPDIARLDDKFKQECIDGGGNKFDCKYTIVANGNNYRSKKMNKTYNGVTVGPYEDIFLLLDAETCSEGVCPDYDPEGNDLYYAAANHVTLQGEFMIKGFTIKMEPLTCDDIRGVSTTVAHYNNGSGVKETTCGSDPAIFYDCIESDPNAPIEGTIYYRDDNPACPTKNNYYISGGVHYLPVKVIANVLLIQEGKFDFKEFSPNVVRAGKGFSFNNSSAGISYTNNITFLIAGKYSDTAGALFKNTPFIAYSATRYNTSCEEDLNFNINDEVRKYYAEYDASGANMSNTSLFYYKYPDDYYDSSLQGEIVRGNSLYVADLAIQNEFLEKISYNDNVEGVSKVSDNFKFKSCDSNSALPSCVDKDVDGLWREELSYSEMVRLDNSNQMYIHWKNEWEGLPPSFTNIETHDNQSYRGFGMIVSRKYSYNLPRAYISLNDTAANKYADIVYSKDEIISPESQSLKYLGNKYFVGFKYAYNKSGTEKFDFPFNLDESQASFIDEMDWKLTATCGVDVENGYYEFDGGCDATDCDGNSRLIYGYRPISLSKPFPKFDGHNYNQIAVNWRNWYELNSSRINNMTYDDFDYVITIDDAKISEINTDVGVGHYNQLTNFNENGSSGFVEDYFVEKRQLLSDESYCGLGFFSTNCDK